MPVPAQNTCLRDYANKNKINYSLPQLEHKFDDCYMQLYSTINSALQNDGIVMYSSEMMPDSNKFKKIMLLIIEKKLSLHFVLENLIINDLNGMEKILKVRKIQKNIISRINIKTLKKRVINKI